MWLVRINVAAPVRNASRVVLLRGVQGKARSPVAYCSQQRRPGRVPGSTGAYHQSSQVHRTFVSGCEGPSVAVLRSVLVV